MADVVTNGMRVLRLEGPAGYNYGVEASTNLVDWSAIATLVNTNGAVNFIDAGGMNRGHRFYRAVGP